MSARQLIVLAVAAVAAILALVLIRGVMSARDSAPAEAEVAAIAGEQVLVVTRDVAQGAPLTPSDLGVASFPADSVSQAYVRISAQPSAQADYVGAVTRRPFVAGEPITAGSVIQPEGRGFMAAQLQPGFRAVAIEISPETAAGGFIQPNDHVDVLVTHTPNGASQVRTDIVLEDVRVLALGENTQPQTTGEDGPAKINASVAVLELAAEDARALAMATELGDVSLALRGVQAETVGMRTGGNARNRISQESGAVRIHAHGEVVGGN